MAAEAPLLNDAVDGCVDFKGRTVFRFNSGGWRSASFIIGVEMAERFAYFEISSNLISYLTGPLGQSTESAAENVNAWTGTAMLLPLAGAFFAASSLGRYCAVVVASVICILGLFLLTMSAMLPSQITIKMASDTPNEFQNILFSISLYLVAIGQGGHRPCVQAFGADQFDEQDPEESKAKSSVFNWWYFGLCGATAVSYFIISYIQDNLSWGSWIWNPVSIDGYCPGCFPIWN